LGKEIILVTWEFFIDSWMARNESKHATKTNPRWEKLTEQIILEKNLIEAEDLNLFQNVTIELTQMLVKYWRRERRQEKHEEGIV
jgi:hypothetical protein